MLSRLSLIDGGRDTWISQFLPRFTEAFGRRFVVHCIARADSDIAQLLGDSALIVNVWPGRRLAPWPILFSVGYLARMIGRTLPGDVVLAVGGLNEALPVGLADIFWPSRRKKVLWLRTVYLGEKSKSFGPVTKMIIGKLEHFLIRRFDVVIANGDDTANAYAEVRNDIIVIPNAVDETRWRSAIKKYHAGPLKVAYVGRLSEVKGIRSLFGAIRRISQTPGWQQKLQFFVIGPAQGDMLAEVTALHESALLTFVGPVPNNLLVDQLAEIDVCVNLTFGSGALRGSGVSNSLLEQLAAGKPQITWNAPVYTGVLDETCAIFAKERSEEDLANCMLSMWERRSEIAQMTEAAIRTAERYGWVSHLDAAYNAILAEERR